MDPTASVLERSRLAIVNFDGESVEWDRLVERSEGGTFCHLAGWRDIISDVFGHECLYRVAVDEDGRWQGVLPLVRVKSMLFGHYLVSMPFLNCGGPLGSEMARKRLAEWAREEARNTGADLLELRTRIPVPGGDLRVSDRKITVLLGLPGDPDTLWNEVFRSKLRSQIRRPQKEGMHVKFGPDQVEPFYDVFARNMRDLGTPVLPRLWFRRIAEVLEDVAVFAVVYWQGRAVAGGCGFEWGGEFEIAWASSLNEVNRHAPNMLLYWSLMEEMIRRGVSLFNFGRCTPGGGTHRFKKQWGGEDKLLPWAQWSRSVEVNPPSPDDGVYRIATAVWRHLPLTLANSLGPLVVRNLP